jgi:hypothetical protein
MGRTPTDTGKLQEMKPLDPVGKKKLILLEAYKKHATELTNIEDRQNKLSLLILGIFSAGATLVANEHFPISPPLAGALIFFAVAIIIPSFHYNIELHALRRVTRELLVRCEIALGFHEKNCFLLNEKLYSDDEIGYGSAKKGKWLRLTFYLTTGAVCLAFIVIVIAKAIRNSGRCCVPLI